MVGIIDTTTSPYAKLRSVDLKATTWRPGFWADRFAQCREVTLPRLWELLADPERGHALTNLCIAAGLEHGEFAGTHWQDEWVYKWLEAASYIYGLTADAALDRRMDETIAIIAKAQQPDGYLATQTTVRGWPRFQDFRHHETYVMGHLITAACIHHRVTGKTNFLDLARKVGDCLHATFVPLDPALAHLESTAPQIMALVELYRTTGERRYLDVANVFIDMRGSHPDGSDVNQNRVPLREEQQVVGHAVRFTYLYAGATDAYMETGDEALRTALERLWHDLTERKTYVHGGVGALHRGFSLRDGRATDVVVEAVGAPYELPNSTSYNETCAQIGSFMWNWRLLAVNGDARHADAMELALYNGILSGVDLAGVNWFYTNVLRWYGQDHPLLWQDAYQRFEPGQKHNGRKHICCPTNLLRTVAGLHAYLYSVSEDGLWVNLYGASAFDGQLPDGTHLRLVQETTYPWQGDVRFVVEEAPTTPFSIHLRIPEWAVGAIAVVNGVPVEEPIEPSTYARLERAWSDGDTIELRLPMQVRLLEGHPRIEATRNQVAVQRGPIIYCLESPDLPVGTHVSDIHLPSDIELIPRHDPRLLGGVTILDGVADVMDGDDWTGAPYRELSRVDPNRRPIALIPYFAWCNRGISEMTIWLPLTRSSASS